LADPESIVPGVGNPENHEVPLDKWNSCGPPVGRNGSGANGVEETRQRGAGESVVAQLVVVRAIVRSAPRFGNTSQSY